MLQCPQCGEMNNENSYSCWKCHFPMPASQSKPNLQFQSNKKSQPSGQTKICPKCKVKYDNTKLLCPDCGSFLKDLRPPKSIPHPPRQPAPPPATAPISPSSTPISVPKAPLSAAPSYPNTFSCPPKVLPKFPQPRWLYLVAILFPIFGVIIGCTYLLHSEYEFGKKLILTSFIASIVVISFQFIWPNIEKAMFVSTVEDFFRNPY